MSGPLALAAVDLGASSGRVVLGRVGPDTLELTEVSRFRNGPVPLPDGLYWDALGLYLDVLDGSGRPSAGPAAWPGSRSTPGVSTTACSTSTARCSATPTTTATTGPPQSSTTCTASSTRPGCTS